MKPSDGDVIETEPGVYSVLADGESFEVRVTGGEIAVAGRRIPFEVEDPRKWKRASVTGGAQGTAVLKAAMPGRIIRILVKPGDEVAAGQGILVIEAMKMQNEIKAPRAGCVSNISVQENDSVNAGATLATIE